MNIFQPTVINSSVIVGNLSRKLLRELCRKIETDTVENGDDTCLLSSIATAVLRNELFRFLTSAVFASMFSSLISLTITQSLRTSGSLQPDGCKLSILLTSSHVRGKCAVFPA